MIPNQAEPLLAVTGLTKHYVAPRRWFARQAPAVQAVDDVSFNVDKGETLSPVGEAGCGKTTTAKSVMRLIEPTSGSVRLEGSELVGLSAEKMRERRRDMQIIFQDPYASLNPRMRAGDIVGEPLRNFADVSRGERRERVQWLFSKVGLRPESAMKYAHEFSGGQPERLGIARGLVWDPTQIGCHAPVSGLEGSAEACRFRRKWSICSWICKPSSALPICLLRTTWPWSGTSAIAWLSCTSDVSWRRAIAMPFSHRRGIPTPSCCWRQRQCLTHGSYASACCCKAIRPALPIRRRDAASIPDAPWRSPSARQRFPS